MGFTALSYAAQYNNAAVVKWLAEKGGAEVDKANNAGGTPLFISSQKGYLEMVKLLLAEARGRTLTRPTTTVSLPSS